MNNVVYYQAHKHLEQLQQWYNDWKISLDVIDMLPTTGLIIEDICALFLYETNSYTCFLESFIVNPKVPKADRKKYFNQIGEVMIHMAKESGYRYMKCDTRYETVENQLKEFGFNTTNHNYHSLFRSL